MSNADLIKRLEAAESGSRELDKAQMLACGITMSQVGFDRFIPAYTTSIDAIVALIGEKSPLRGPVHLDMAGSGFCAIEPVEPCSDPVTAFGNTPPLACCIALLKALDQNGGEHG